MNQIIALLAFTACCLAQPNFNIARVAGVRASATDPISSRDALLNVPYGITADRAGNIYFHDRSSYTIRKRSTDGLITLFAGNGTVGTAGDGGQADAAQLNGDIGSMTFGPDGALYFADGWNCTVRRVTSGGFMELVAGTPGRCGYSGDGGPATAARLNILGTVSFDAEGNLYIGDGFNHRVRRVRPDGIIETFAGTGTPGFSGDGGPAAVARLNLPGAHVDRSGNVWILDAANFRIRRVDREGIITTVAGTGTPGMTPDNGPAATSPIGFITYAAPEPNGGLYFSDRSTAKMYLLTADGVIRNVAGSGRVGFAQSGSPATAADITTADDLAVAPDGSVVFSDQLNHVIRRLTPAGTVEIVAGRSHFASDYGPSWEQLLNGPAAAAWDPNGGYYVYEEFGARLRRVDPDGTMYTIAGTGEHGVSGDGGPARKARIGMVGTAPGKSSLAVDTAGRVYLLSASCSCLRRVMPGGRIERIAGTGVPGYAGEDGPAGEARLNGPQGLALSSDGRIFIADTNNHRIRVIEANGTIRTFAGTGTRGFNGDGGPARSAQLALPTALALDRNGDLFFLDTGNNRIRKISREGAISTIAGNGVAGNPVDGLALAVPLADLSALAVGSDGGLIFAESTGFFPAARLRYLSTNGRIVSLSRRTFGYGGDGGRVGDAAFAEIPQIAVSSSGEILIPDRLNGVVRWLAPN